jgi:hypothetical protein
MRKLFVVVAVLAIVVLSAPSIVLAQAPIVGTWELNVSKSKMTPGPLPKSLTRSYEVTGKQEKSVQKGVDAEGKPMLVQFTVNYDGKDYPYIGSPLWDTLALTAVDNLTTSFVQKKDGKVALTGQRVISKDGKTMTITGKGTSPTGQPTELFMVFERR